MAQALWWRCRGSSACRGSARGWPGPPIRLAALNVCSEIQSVLLLAGAKVGSLLINRGGKVGGELYWNELDTMARAVTGARHA